ncbi:hypothetical protein GGI11_002523, partial [Coemansia sp. RSA 2049]
AGPERQQRQNYYVGLMLRILDTVTRTMMASCWSMNAASLKNGYGGCVALTMPRLKIVIAATLMLKPSN